MVKTKKRGSRLRKTRCRRGGAPLNRDFIKGSLISRLQSTDNINTENIENISKLNILPNDRVHELAKKYSVNGYNNSNNFGNVSPLSRNNQFATNNKNKSFTTKNITLNTFGNPTELTSFNNSNNNFVWPSINNYFDNILLSLNYLQSIIPENTIYKKYIEKKIEELENKENKLKEPGNEEEGQEYLNDLTTEIYVFFRHNKLDNVKINKYSFEGTIPKDPNLEKFNPEELMRMYNDFYNEVGVTDHKFDINDLKKYKIGTIAESYHPYHARDEYQQAFQTQKSLFCGIHSINNLFIEERIASGNLKPVCDKKMMDSTAEGQAKNISLEPTNLYNKITGNYNISTVELFLQRMGTEPELIFTYAERVKENTNQSFKQRQQRLRELLKEKIINLRDDESYAGMIFGNGVHYTALRRIDRNTFDFRDSMQPYGTIIQRSDFKTDAAFLNEIAKYLVEYATQGLIMVHKPRQ